jgi:hypothetical protein
MNQVDRIQLRYAEHYYEYSHKKLGRKNENCL